MQRGSCSAQGLQEPSVQPDQSLAGREVGEAEPEANREASETVTGSDHLDANAADATASGSGKVLPAPRLAQSAQTVVC